MKRLLSVLLVLAMLVPCGVVCATAADAAPYMLSRTSEIDHSWQELAANQTLAMIGTRTTTGVDSAQPDPTPNANKATTHASQTSDATPGTLWLRNTNTWAFGYVIEVSGLEPGEATNLSVQSAAWGHDHSGTQGGGWTVAPWNGTVRIAGNGIYAIYINGHMQQMQIQRPQRYFLLWIRQFDMSFNKAVKVRVLSELEAVSGATDPDEPSNFDSCAKVVYHDRTGKVVKTDDEVNMLGAFSYMSERLTAVAAPELSCDLPDYTEGGVTYTLAGWSQTPGASRPDTFAVIGSMDLYPVYQAVGVPYVNFMNEDGSEELDRAPIIPGKKVSTDVVPVKELGDEHTYTFDGWVDAGGNKVDLDKLTTDTDVYAHFSRDLKDLTVTFWSEDQKTQLGTVTVKYGNAVTGAPTATKESTRVQSFTFNDWVLFNGDPIDLTNVTASVDVRASFDAEYIDPFVDVNDGSWYEAAVEDMVVKGIIDGISPTQFAPDMNANRAMFATVLYRMEGSPDVSGLTTPFKDVKDTDYFAAPLKWAYNYGIVNGVSPTEYRPNDPLTREQMATMLYRYANEIRYYDMSVTGYVDPDFLEYSDNDQIDDYAKEALLWMTQESRAYIRGVDAGGDLQMQPRANATRATMATILSRFLEEQNKLAQEFANPAAEFSPTPFWFWNDTLSEEEIERQIRAFKEKGVDGFVIHPRLGLEDIEYMGEDWLHYVRFAVELADELGMHVFLYDEAMYPSGSCRGQVVAENPEYASKGIAARTTPTLAAGEKLIAQTEINGTTYYFVQSFTYGTIRGLTPNEDDGKPNAPRSSDLLNPDAVATFIRLTHQKYYDELSEYFGNTIQAIFTDEPSVTGRRTKADRVNGQSLVGWTDDLLEEYLAAGNTLQDLYYLCRDYQDYLLSEGANKSARMTKYLEVINARLNRVYYGQIAQWCTEHNIALTGHPGDSMDIGLLENFDIPCQDIVWWYLYPGDGTNLSGRNSTMGKCASDSARHAGKRRNGNECFGVCYRKGTNYEFEREDMKWYIDWLFSRGCNLIIPHAFYYSMRGYRAEERPPEVGMNSVFWDEYKEISDYVKRCCAMNTDSVNVTDIAVLCTETELPFGNVVRTLYENQIEFNYLQNDLLDQVKIENGMAKIARQSYRVIITDRKYDAATEAFLTEFAAAGGTVIRSTGAQYLSNVRAASRTDLDIEGTADLRMTHVRKYGVDAVFLSNEGEDALTFTINEKVAQIWDAETGKMIENFSGDSLTMKLDRRQSIYLILK